MARNFHDDATQFMTDLLKLLRQQATSTSLGETVSGEESAISTLLRLIGVEKKIVLDVDGDAENTSEKATTESATLLDNFFKIQTGATRQQLDQVNRLLKAYKKRLRRYSKGRVAMKLNRTKKLIQEPTEPIVAGELVKTTPEQTRKEISSQQKELQESGEVAGIVDQSIALQRAQETSVNSAAVVPDNTGAFGSQLQKLILATGKDASDTVDKLVRFKSDIQNEVTRLEDTDKLLFEGSNTFGSTDQTLSLLGVLNVLIFLTDTQQLKYDCSQCKFFRTGNVDVCIFAGKGAISNTPLVEITDENNNLVTGRQTMPTNSCKDVWGLSSNEYFTPSDSLKDNIKEILKE